MELGRLPLAEVELQEALILKFNSMTAVRLAETLG
jgi:hypothetical protein